MKFYQLSELDLKELGINPNLIVNRELLGCVDNARVDVEACLSKSLSEEEWENMKQNYQTSNEAADVSEAINTFLQREMTK